MSERSVWFFSGKTKNSAIHSVAAQSKVRLRGEIPPTRQRAANLLRPLAIAGLIILGSLSEPLCAVACKPVITPIEVRFSDVGASQRVWTAVLVVNAFHCATSAGRFEIDFVRLKDNAPDLQFTEQFTWTPGRIEVSVNLWADETIQDYRIGFIAPCVCRDPPWR